MGRLIFINWKGQRRPRRDVIHELAAAGTPVAEIARQLDVPYQMVYQALQAPPAPRNAETIPERQRGGSKGRLVFIDWNGQRRPRRDVIQELAASGSPVAEIARLLGVRYQIVYMALHGSSSNDHSLSIASRKSARPSDEWEKPDAILVGCVKSKNESSMAAKDLYTSELFRRRRLWAEASGVPWWVFSSEYGFVPPNEVIAPYDTRIGRLPPTQQARLAETVVEGLEKALGGLRGKVIELHAGEDYARAVRPALQRRGASLSRPLEGLAFGEQLAWYGERLALKYRTPTSRPGATRPALPQRQPLGEARGLSAAITKLFFSAQLDLSDRPQAPPAGWDGMPEIVAANRIRALGASHSDVRLFLTFIAAMDRARDADILARRAVQLFERDPWAYQPDEISRRSVLELTDALRGSGVSQRHSVDVYAWRILAETLADTSRAPVARGALFRGEADARELLHEVQTTTPEGTAFFPLLSGPKVSALWVRLLAYPGGATISSMAEVPVAVDVQVRKVSEYLGVTDTAGLRIEDARALIQETWARDVAAHGAAGPPGIANTPGALDPALWFYGKWGCTFCEVAGRRRPISAICSDCRLGTSRITERPMPSDSPNDRARPSLY